MLLAGVGYVLLPAAEKARFADIGKDTTSVQRLDYWKAGLKMIENHPFLGVGYFNFAPVYAAHDRAHLWHGKAQLPHNIFIQVGTDAGLIGLGIFLMLIYRNLKVARDIRRACAKDPEVAGICSRRGPRIDNHDLGVRHRRSVQYRGLLSLLVDEFGVDSLFGKYREEEALKNVRPL